jgi:hypothetical protein
MKRIPIDQAKPGMILAEDVVRKDGLLLAGRGSSVTPALIRALERMDLDSLPVDDGQALTPEEQAQKIEKARDDLDARFSRVMDDPILAALHQTLWDRAGGNPK